MESSEHFKGKSVVDHLKEARQRGAMASAEIHGTEMPGHLAAFADSSKETALVLMISWVIFFHFFPPFFSTIYVLLFTSGWIIWKTARSALLGWSRMERVHRLIEEERWEIEHHRAQEKEELTEMYQAKGLTGKLLEETVDVLMADDNRLLRVMLEEELGLSLEAYEHPLKQAFGAFLGALFGSVFCVLGIWIAPEFGILPLGAVVIITSSFLSAKLERNRIWDTIIWNLAIAGVTLGACYFISTWFNESVVV